jgi:hypothetical protein
MYLVAASLIWAGRALDYFDRGKQRRNYLRATAKEVGCDDELQLSRRYRERTAKAAQARRLATKQA